MISFQKISIETIGILHSNSDMEIKPRKIKDYANGTKLSLSVNSEAGKLYFEGKQNGWDTTELARQAVEAALLANRDQLLKKTS